MVYIIFIRLDPVFSERMTSTEMLSYHPIRYFLPLLEERGATILIDDPAHQVVPIHQFLAFENQKSLYVFFSPPENIYQGIDAPKIFINDISPKDQPSIPSPIASIGGMIHNEASTQNFSTLVNLVIAPFIIPPPLWEDWQRLFEQNQQGIDAPKVIHTNGRVFDSYLPKGKPKAKSTRIPFPWISFREFLKDKHESKVNIPWFLRYLAFWRLKRYDPHAIQCEGVIYTAIVSPSTWDYDWQSLVQSFQQIFSNQQDAILIIKMVGQVSKRVRYSSLKLIKKNRKRQCRLVIIHGHLATEAFESLVQSTSYYINCATSNRMSTSMLEFMSAGKPVLSSQSANPNILSKENAFLLPKKGASTSFESALKESYELLLKQPEAYWTMAASANRSMQTYCSSKVIKPQFNAYLDQIEAQMD